MTITYLIVCNNAIWVFSIKHVYTGCNQDNLKLPLILPKHIFTSAIGAEKYILLVAKFQISVEKSLKIAGETTI